VTWPAPPLSDCCERAALATTDTSPALRLTFLTVIVIGLFVALFSRLWFLQVLAGDRYVELADTNRLRTVVTEAPRGGSSPPTARSWSRTGPR
jgi:cell division protein FtsI/penicillin-binding protein 2